MGFLDYEDYDRYGSRGSSGVNIVTIVLVILIIGAAVAGALYYSKNKTTNIKEAKEYTVKLDSTFSYGTQIKLAVKQLINEEDELTTIEKYKILHDFTTKVIDYDYAKLVSGGDFRLGHGPNDPAKALESGKGVCGAYALIFKDLCDSAGLNCKVVTGKAFLPGAGSMEGHAWNVVEVDGNWYHVDCCWSDTGGELYGYFMRGERFIQVGDGGNFRTIDYIDVTLSDTDYKFDRNRGYENINIIRI